MPTIPFTVIDDDLTLLGESVADPDPRLSRGVAITSIQLSADAASPADVEIGYSIPGGAGDVFVPVFKVYGVGLRPVVAKFRGGIPISTDERGTGRRLAVITSADIAGTLEVYRLLQPLPPPPPPPVELQTIVQTGLDDGQCIVSAESFNATNPSTSFGLFFGNTTDMFWRFPGLAIPPGATIVSASISLHSLGNVSAGPVVARIRAFDEDSAAAPTDTATFLHVGAVTDAFTDWTLPAMVTGQRYSSDDIAAVVQEVVDRPGWLSGNAIVLQAINNGSTNRRVLANYESFDSSGLDAAILSVVYQV